MTDNMRHGPVNGGEQTIFQPIPGKFIFDPYLPGAVIG
jgi:hypothetical protein